MAIKILSAYATSLQGRVFHELECLQRIADNGARTTQHRGLAHLPTLIDHFHLASQHGKHLCIVTPALGSTLGSLKAARGSGAFPIPLVKKVASQCLQALDFLHNECGIVHTGTFSSEDISRTIAGSWRLWIDIKHDNIHISVRETTETLRIEETIPDVASGAPTSRPIVTMSAADTSNPHLDVHITLADFGSGIEASNTY